MSDRVTSMLLNTIELRDFRNFGSLDLALSPGVTVLLGKNGQGKSNLVEAIGYLATLSSFRGATDAAMVRDGCEAAIIRAEGVRDGRRLQIEAEIRHTGRNRTMVNRQPLRRSRDLLGALRVTVFAPDDLELIKGGPAWRRTYVDDLAVAIDPSVDVARSTFERVLRQRNALLKQAKGRLTDDVATSLDVWDIRFVEAADVLGRLRRRLVDDLGPLVSGAYHELSGDRRPAAVSYRPAWREDGLGAALIAARDDDVRRGVSTVGPHRDEIDAMLGARPARSHASQGEQRTFSLALRLAGHRLVTIATGSSPILLLDDVFSELDESRRVGLLEHLPGAQTIITTAADLPRGTDPEVVLTVANGKIRA